MGTGKKYQKSMHKVYIEQKMKAVKLSLAIIKVLESFSKKYPPVNRVYSGLADHY